MAEKEKKKGLGLLVAALAGITGIVLLARKAGAAEGYGADVGITLSADPNALVPGTTYTANVKVTNKSTKAGVGVPATLTVRILAQLAGVAIGTDLTRMDVYPANTQLTVPETGYEFRIPTDGGGKSGTITATVLDLAGNVLKVATLPIAVQAVVAPTGIVGPGLIWYEPMTGWAPIVDGRQIPVGATVSIAPTWRNTSSVPIIGQVGLAITWPHGEQYSPSSSEGNNQRASPNIITTVRFFFNDTATNETYTLKTQLWSEGMLLDEITFTLIAIAEIVYAADVVISV